MKVQIYALVDPITCKIRYIGRTKTSLETRLSQHIHRAKYGKAKTHKENWIRSLLKINCKPLIRCLTIIDGWEESYEFEVNLIDKYKDRLTNFYDLGPGKLRTTREEDKLKISETLKEGYISGRIARPEGRTIYAYNSDGTFFKEFTSIAEAGRFPEMSRTTIKNHINCIPKGKYLRSKYQFSAVRVERMFDYTS